ncbi:MAG TPA: peptidylprolyl isomerase, partial [Anaeromyxobacteraceae bacterium]|nr:peptidylprolyl isomerase [Anaeromyxobacteraceae bacterium]
PAAPASQETYAVFHTSRGKIGVKLLPGVAPQAVKNFVELAQGKKAWTDPATGAKVQKPLYDGTLFHRVIPGFMIQGGDPLTREAPPGKTATASGQPFGTGSPGFRFPDEIDREARPFQVPCQLAMANSGPNTNGSQFFITEVATPHLNPKPCGAPSGVCGYVHFGSGVCGCDLVRPIALAGNSQTRLEKVVITTERPTCK